MCITLRRELHAVAPTDPVTCDVGDIKGRVELGLRGGIDVQTGTRYLRRQPPRTAQHHVAPDHKELRIHFTDAPFAHGAPDMKIPIAKTDPLPMDALPNVCFFVGMHHVPIERGLNTPRDRRDKAIVVASLTEFAVRKLAIQLCDAVAQTNGQRLIVGADCTAR